MRVIPFPSERPLPGQDAWTAELEAALAGELRGQGADAWRELREDVRSLAQPMTPEFEARMRDELERRGALRTHTELEDERGLRAPRRGLAAHRRATLGVSVAAAAAALAAALVIAGPHGSRTPIRSAGPQDATLAAPASAGAPSTARAARADKKAPAGTSLSRDASSSEMDATGAASAPGRVQQLAASLTLGASASGVQTISDQVARLTVREGGYVQSSSVHVQQHATSEAALVLRLPSARLSAALAAIGRLAPVRAENQSLEDITNTYDTAHRQLADALAERSALLRALATATTEGQIDSLRERLAQTRGAISRAQTSVNAVSQRASTAEVEVSVLGDPHNPSAGLTLDTGLHDAGRVLVVALIVILIACAALVPLALVAATLIGASRGWRRYQRERALEAP
jgi:Domain of unknown function (DUF4349)